MITDEIQINYVFWAGLFHRHGCPVGFAPCKLHFFTSIRSIHLSYFMIDWPSMLRLNKIKGHIHCMSIIWSVCIFIMCPRFLRMCRWRKQVAAPDPRPQVPWRSQKGIWKAVRWRWTWTVTRLRWRKFWPGCCRPKMPCIFKMRCQMM